MSLISAAAQAPGIGLRQTLSNTCRKVSTPPERRSENILDLLLRGRTAVITGASRGIGLAITHALVAEGRMSPPGAEVIG
jgi:hypothetical protein